MDILIKSPTAYYHIRKASPEPIRGNRTFSRIILKRVLKAKIEALETLNEEILKDRIKELKHEYIMINL